MAYEQNILKGHEISTLNSTTALLASGASFTGTWENVVNFSTAAATILGSMATSGYLYFDISTDGGSTYTSVPSEVTDTTWCIPRILNVIETHYRVRYVNGDTAMTGTFSIQTKHSNAQPIALLASAGGTVRAETPVQVMKTVGVGRKPDGGYKDDPANGVAITNTVALASGAVFISDWIDSHGYNDIEIVVVTDQLSEADGIHVEFTSDLTSPSGVLESKFSYDGDDVIRGYKEAFVSPKLVGFRVKYHNGNTLQSSFLLQVDLKTHGTVTTSLDQKLGGHEDVLLVRDGSHFQLDVARKHIAKVEAAHIIGGSSSIGVTVSDVFPGGGDYPWPESSAKIAIASSDAADTFAGLGVRTVEVHGLSATGADQDEIISMSGTTESESALTYSRVNSVHNEEVGTYGGSHQGDVTIRVTSAGAGTGDILGVMKGDEGSVDSSVQYGKGETQNGFYTVPSGKVMYITHLEVIPDVGGNKTASVYLYEREGILDLTTPFQPRRQLWAEKEIQENVEKEFNSYLKIKGLTDIWFRATSTTASSLFISLDYYLVDADADGK